MELETWEITQKSNPISKEGTQNAETEASQDERAPLSELPIIKRKADHVEIPLYMPENKIIKADYFESYYDDEKEEQLPPDSPNDDKGDTSSEYQDKK